MVGWISVGEGKRPVRNLQHCHVGIMRKPAKGTGTNQRGPLRKVRNVSSEISEFFPRVTVKRWWRNVNWKHTRTHKHRV